MESEIHWPVQNIFFFKEDGPLTMVMTFVSTSVIVVFSDKRIVTKPLIHVEISSFPETSQRTASTLCTACITCSESLHTECVVFVRLP